MDGFFSGELGREGRGCVGQLAHVFVDEFDIRREFAELDESQRDFQVMQALVVFLEPGCFLCLAL